MCIRDRSSTLWRKFPWFFGQWSETVGWWEHISYTSFTFNQWQATSCDQGNTPPTQLSPSMTNNIWRSKRTNACKPHENVTAPFPVMVYIKLLCKSSTLWRKFPWFFGQWSETVGWWEHISYTSFTFNQWQATSCDQGNTPPTQLSPSMTNNIWRSKRTNACKPHKAIESATDMAHNTFEGLW